MTMTTEMEVATKYQSHLPALLACVASTVGPVLELGVGYFSTPQLHAICGASKRFLVSVESDAEWLKYFSDRYASVDHWFKSEKWSLLRYGVAFIDHSPGGENRAKAFKELIELSDYVVVHDYHDDNEAAIAPLLHDLTRYVCKLVFPPTLVASKTKEIPPVLIGT